jgi:hypothetical protein
MTRPGILRLPCRRTLFQLSNDCLSIRTALKTAMARQRKVKETKIKLKQPDRSGPDPSRQSLLEIAEQRGILHAQKGQKEDGSYGDAEDGDPSVGRLGESMLWSVSLTMLHFTLDVLVSNQYAIEIVWRDIILRAAQAFPSEPFQGCSK